MKRTISDILKEADEAVNLKELIDLWNEIANNKYQYPLVQLDFANEHISNLSLKIKGCDLEKGKFYLFLNKSVK